MSIRYVIKEGVSGIKRARLAAFTSIFSLLVAVFLMGVLTRVGYNAYEIAQTLRQQVEIEVFLQDISRQSTDEVRQKLQESPLIESLMYISKDSASAIFQEEFGVGGEAMAELNFLPASFKLKVNRDADLNEVDQFVQEVQSLQEVDEVKFNLALLQMLESRMEISALVGGGLAFIILFTAIVLVFNTIRLTIYAKKDLIRAMKLVGATNGFIRRPFLVEGLLQGFIAGSIACALIYGIFTWLIPRYIPQLGVLEWPFGRWYYLLGGLLLLALFMGLLGSRWASRKFIRDATVYG
ncbi:MAG: permease-like cell division protein FtsX [Balneolaceae bacterium]